MTPGFLDTTAVIDRATGWEPGSSRAKAAAALHAPISTSRLAQLEMKRGFLQHLVMVHNKLQTTGNLGEVLVFLSRLASTRLVRKASVALRGIGEYFKRMRLEEGVDPDQFVLEQTKNSLRNTIRRCWASFGRGMKEVVESPCCELDAPLLTLPMIENTTRKCDRGCDMASFVQKNVTNLKKIREILHGGSKKDGETSKRIRELRRALKHPRETDVAKFCWYCCDVVFALQCAPGGAVVTSNVKHLEPICRSVGRTVEPYKP